MDFMASTTFAQVGKSTCSSACADGKTLMMTRFAASHKLDLADGYPSGSLEVLCA